ncbi:MAG: terminase family protein [Bryobacteraceae bacterium]
MNPNWLVNGLDGVEFARTRLGFEPDAKQSLMLGDRVRRGLLNCSRQWGKSTVAAAKAVHVAETRPKSLVLVLSPTHKQSAELVRKAGEFVQRLGRVPRGDGQNPRSLLFPNGSRIVALAGREATVRGFSAVTLLLIDEASRVSDDLYRAVRPMLAVSGGDLWLMSTPCGKRGFFYEEWAHGGDQWVRVAVTGEECSRIDQALVAEERANENDRWFRQEYCCEFVDNEESLFDSDVIRAAIQDDVLPLDLRRRL